MIGIKNFEIPKSCSDCALCYDYIACSITNTHVNYEALNDERLDDCPLIEVKEYEEKRTVLY